MASNGSSVGGSALNGSTANSSPSHSLDGGNHGPCRAAWEAPAPLGSLFSPHGPNHDVGAPSTSYFFFLRGLAKVVLVGGLFLFLRRKHEQAKSGDLRAARYVIQPLYKRAFDAFFTILAAAAVVSVAVPYPVTFVWQSDDGARRSEFAVSSLVWLLAFAAETAIELGLLAFLAHDGIGGAAFHRAKLTGLCWGLLVSGMYIHAIVASLAETANDLSRVDTSIQTLKALFSGTILAMPLLRSRAKGLRPAAVWYTLFVFATSGLLAIAGHAMPSEGAYCGEMALRLVRTGFGMVVYLVLLKDTVYWRRSNLLAIASSSGSRGGGGGFGSGGDLRASGGGSLGRGARLQDPLLDRRRFGGSGSGDAKRGQLVIGVTGGDDDPEDDADDGALRARLTSLTGSGKPACATAPVGRAIAPRARVCCRCV